MSFSEFVRACENSTTVQVVQALCLNSEEITATYVKYPYRMDTPKLFYSMTKTVTSLAIGIAEDQGLLSVEDPIVKYFPDLLPENPHPNLEKITIRHLLTMSCGIDTDTYPQIFVQDNWPRAFLAQDFPKKPGTHFLYCTHGSHMLSAIITRVSGLSLEDYVNHHLFHPMGIYEAKWEHSPEGLTAGGMGLSLRPDSLVKIARLFLGKGVFEGKRLLSQRYLDMATTTQVTKQDYVDDPNYEYFGHRYGFQIHVGKEDYFRMEGSFGQLCLVAPDRDLAVLIFCQNANFEHLLQLVYTHLLKGDELSGDLASGEPSAPQSPKTPLPLGTYAMEQNDLGLKQLTLRKAEEDYEAVLRFESYENVIRFSPEGDRRGKMIFVKDLEDHLQEYICQSSFDPLYLKTFLIETPYVAEYTFVPQGEDLRLDFKINVSFTLHDCSIYGKKIR
ncbi:MAG: serine hydrolase [Oscillospiraceae bacterium]|nr:serine hydrolase [Oscillospiraceae bacterium]